MGAQGKVSDGGQLVLGSSEMLPWWQTWAGQIAGEKKLPTAPSDFLPKNIKLDGTNNISQYNCNSFISAIFDSSLCSVCEVQATFSRCLSELFRQKVLADVYNRHNFWTPRGLWLTITYNYTQSSTWILTFVCAHWDNFYRRVRNLVVFVSQILAF